MERRISSVDILVIFVASMLITMAVHRYTLAKGVLDIPNSRSSHTRPTPRGGGISFVVSFSTYLIVSWIRGTADPNLVVALVGGGLVIALIGWIDDRRGLSAALRLTVHLIASAWALFWIRPTWIDLGVLRFETDVLVYITGILIIAWLTNLFNFMDGIDGIASVEAASCGLAVWLITGRTGEGAVAFTALAFASAVLGFLPMNWSPAKIFMGDVGSGYLGFVLGTLSIASEGLGGPPTWAWMILLAVFITDATMTLIRRVLRGESWHEAHRTHVYQLAVQAGYSHRMVSVSVLGTNVLLSIVCRLALRGTNAESFVIATFALLLVSHVFLYRLWGQHRPTSSYPGVADR